MTQYLPEFLTVVVIHLLAAMSPGPDFILITRNSMIYSRSVGIYSAMGLGLGILVHVTYSLVGLALIISKSILLYSILKFLGAGYLIYIGYKSLTAKAPSAEKKIEEKHRHLGKMASVRMGFLTNILNPKVTLFFFALFTQVIHPTTPKFIQVIYGLEMSIMTFVWFAFVSIVLSHDLIKKRFMKAQHRLEQVFGVLLIALGLKVAFSTSR